MCCRQRYQPPGWILLENTIVLVACQLVSARCGCGWGMIPQYHNIVSGKGWSKRPRKQNNSVCLVGNFHAKEGKTFSSLRLHQLSDDTKPRIEGLQYVTTMRVHTIWIIKWMRQAVSLFFRFSKPFFCHISKKRQATGLDIEVSMQSQW